MDDIYTYHIIVGNFREVLIFVWFTHESQNFAATKINDARTYHCAHCTQDIASLDIYYGRSVSQYKSTDFEQLAGV